LKNWCEEVSLPLGIVQKFPVSIDACTLFVFTDGSWENGVAGTGAVVIDESTGHTVVIQDRVCQDLLESRTVGMTWPHLNDPDNQFMFLISHWFKCYTNVTQILKSILKSVQISVSHLFYGVL